MFRPRPCANRVLPVVTPLESRVCFDATYFNLASGPLQQNWSNTGLITTANDWSLVPSIVGFLGDGRSAAGSNPNTFFDEPTTTQSVVPNQTAFDAPTTNTGGGIYEFESPLTTTNPDPTVGMQGSGTADTPNLKLYLNTTGQTSVPVSYLLRDLDTTDAAIQQFIAQYRVGTTGNFTNIDASYVADASADGATLTTPVSFNLPAAALGQAQVELRIMTADAVGSDAMVGIDNIVVGGVVANTYNFDPASYSVNEGAGTITLTVTRGTTTAAGSVNYATANGTAVAGTLPGGDYTATSGTLNFGVGVASQTFNVPILNDSVPETLESFTVALSTPVGGALGSSATATVSIVDNDVVAPTGLLLNEVSANPPGTDVPNEYIELRGTPGQQLLGVYALSVEGDAAANTGAITAAFDLSSGTIGSNGLLVVKGATSTLTFDPATGVVNNALFDTGTNGVLQNGANSFLIVYSPNAAPSGDLDANNDGVIDGLPAGASLLDGAGYVTSTAGVATVGDIAYGAVLPPLASVIANANPDALTRLPTNTTPLSAAAFYGGDLEGAANTSVAYITTDATRLTPNTPAAAVLTPGAANFGGSGGDTTPPTVDTSSFVFDVLTTPQSLLIDFSENVLPSLAPSDIVLLNTTTGVTIPTANIALNNYNSTNDVATFRFPGYANGVLPDGRYTLTLAANSVSDAAGNGLALPYTANFFYLAGDLNRDGKVTIADFNLFIPNFGATSGKTNTLGDLNYDGAVNIGDFNIFAINFGKII